MQAAVPARPLVSVLMAAYNAEATIAEAIDSVLRQTWDNLELIIVDDGSTDATAAVLVTYVAAHGARIRVLTQAHQGLAAARNAGCRAAHGEYLAIMDADDGTSPQRIAIQMEVLRCLDRVALCCSEFSAFDDKGPIAARYAIQYYTPLAEAGGPGAMFGPRLANQELPHPVHVGDVYDVLAFGNFVHPGTLLFRRSVFERAGPFDTNLRNHGDWEWIVRAARTGQVAFVDMPLLDYRISPTQRSAAGNRAERAVDTLAVAQQIWQRDPALVAGNPERRRRLLAGASLAAADALSIAHKTRALHYLRRHVAAGGGIGGDGIKVLLKILTPAWLMHAWRQLRGRNPDGSRPTG